VSGNSFGFEAAAHDQCVPLPLQGDVDVEVQALVLGMIGHSASPDFIEGTTAWLAGSTRLARKDAERSLSERGLPTFGAWVLLPEPRLLQPGPLAFLRAGPLATGASDDDALGAVFDLSAELYGELEVDALDTASGDAFVVRRRPVLTVDGERQVHEQQLVLWPRPDDEVVIHLSVYAVDLVQGGRAGQPLRELAASLCWSIT